MGEARPCANMGKMLLKASKRQSMKWREPDIAIFKQLDLLPSL